MNSYEKLKEIRKLKKKLKNPNNNNVNKNKIEADIQKLKNDLLFTLTCVEDSMGKKYTILIEMYYFNGLTDDEIDIEKKVKKIPNYRFCQIIYIS